MSLSATFDFVAEIQIAHVFRDRIDDNEFAICVMECCNFGDVNVKLVLDESPEILGRLLQFGEISTDAASCDPLR